jgi:hypothetical protein
MLVRTTDYVALEHLRVLREQGPFLDAYTIQDKAGGRPVCVLYETQKDGTRERVSPAEEAKRTAKYKRDFAAWEKRAKAAKAAILAEYQTTPAGERRFTFDIGSSVMGKNLAKRVRIMRKPHVDRLTRLDAQIARLQGKRKSLIEQAWDQGIAIVADDLPVLAQRAALPLIKKSGDGHGDRDLDHVDSVWPASIRAETKAREDKARAAHAAKLAAA